MGSGTGCLAGLREPVLTATGRIVFPDSCLAGFPCVEIVAVGPIAATWGSLLWNVGAATARRPISLSLVGVFRPRRSPLGILMASRDINVIALVKGGERYVILYDDESRDQAIEALARHAANPELSFSWHDAAVLGQKVRQNTPRTSRIPFSRRADRLA